MVERVPVDPRRGMVAKVEYPQVTDGTDTLNLSYANDAGTSYDGLDRFGRVVRQRWRLGTDAGKVKAHLAYTYDVNSNRTIRENVAAGSSNQLDETYAHDDLNRLTTMHRGELVGASIPTENSKRTYGEDWTLGGTGNWKDYDIDHDGDYDDAAGDRKGS